MTRIAAIITCHDLGRTLHEALASVEGQTRPAAEIVVVDDGSTQIYTRQLLARLDTQGVRVVQAGGRGASGARNLGAQLTSAEYLVWLDADDVLEPGYFEAAASRLDTDPGIDFVSCAMRAFGAASYVWRPSNPSFVEAIATGAVPHASTMCRRRLWETIGGFDEALPSFELLDFWGTAIERGLDGVVLDEPMLNYRVRPGSGYRRSIQSETYFARLRHFYEKHRTAVERHGLDLIHRKEAFLLSQREYQRTLAARATSLEADFSRLQAEIAEATRQLASHGQPRIEWGDLRRPEPLSQMWGRDRGTPVDRHYIERFLDEHRADIRGRVLEVHQSTYTHRFGGDAVTRGDVIDRDPANHDATFVADLRRAESIPSAAYDCIILTQTLHLVDDMAAVLAECARMLRPGGVLLATVPTLSKVDDESGRDGDFWRLTEASARKLFAESFPLGGFDVAPYGNVKVCSAFLYGMCAEELPAGDLDHQDPAFPLIISVRAVKPEGPAVRLKPDTTEDSAGATSAQAIILAYHRVAALAPDAHRLCIPPDVFRAQMTHVRDHFTPIGLEDLVHAAAAGRIPEGAVAITFDDGYVDAVTDVSPILMELGLPATFFVNTDRLAEAHERWWDILERALSGTALPAALELTIAGQKVHLPTASQSERADALECLNGLAWPLDERSRQRLALDVIAWSGGDAAPRSTHRVLTAEEVRALADRPHHTIGAHTVHHLALTHHQPGTKRAEVLDCRAALEEVIQRPVRLFAYPYGQFDAETIRVVNDAGFLAAVTVEAGMVSAGTNRLLLPRHEVANEPARLFPDRMREMFGLCST